jgi:hypothetical protein
LNRKVVFIVAAVVIFVVLIALVADFYLFPGSIISSVIAPCQNFLDTGQHGEYAGGSSAGCPFSASHAGVLTGAFATNASIDFLILTSQEYSSAIAGSIPSQYFYSLTNVSQGDLNVSLPAGSYFLGFYFTYKYLAPSPFNGSGYEGYTVLNITQSFALGL